MLIPNGNFHANLNYLYIYRTHQRTVKVLNTYEYSTFLSVICSTRHLPFQSMHLHIYIFTMTHIWMWNIQQRSFDMDVLWSFFFISYSLLLKCFWVPQSITDSKKSFFVHCLNSCFFSWFDVSIFTFISNTNRQYLIIELKYQKNTYINLIQRWLQKYFNVYLTHLTAMIDESRFFFIWLIPVENNFILLLLLLQWLYLNQWDWIQRRWTTNNGVLNPVLKKKNKRKLEPKISEVANLLGKKL